MSTGQTASANNVSKIAFAETLSGESRGQDQLPNIPTGVHAGPLGLSGMVSEGQDTDGEGDSVDEIKELDLRIKSLRQPDQELEEAWKRRFNVTMGALIVLNICVIAIETDAIEDDASVEDKIAWIVIDSLFILLFVFEIAVRMWMERRDWIYSTWNWFDVLIVIMAMVDVWIITTFSGDDQANLYVLSIFRIVRLVRLIRLIKLIRLLHGLYVILMAFWHAMQTMSFLLALMLFGLMIYAIFAVNLIGRNANLRHVRINGDTVRDRFGTVYKSMYSLFELMTLEGWESVARPIVEELPYMFLFIASFIMIFTFGMLNMIVALVIEKTMHHSRMMSEHAMQAERDHMADELVRVKTLFNSGGQEAGAGAITITEFETALRESEAVRKIFQNMGISLGDVRELYSVLDWDESGDLTVKEFLEGLQKLQDGAENPWDSLATHSIVRNIKGQATQINERLSRQTISEEAWREELERRLEEQGRLIKDIMSRLSTVSARV